MKELLTQSHLHSLLSYNKETGLFTRLVYSGSRGPIGSTAGSICNGYIKIRVKGVDYYAHRLAVLYVTGVLPNEVDHKNRDKKDNRWDNIRIVTKSENQKNSPLQRNNTSGICGVSFRKSHNKWRAYIKSNGIHIDLGMFTTREEAIQARLDAEFIYNFDPSHGK